MLKIKFFKEDVLIALEYAVNNFIKDKNVINISYTIAPCGYKYSH